MHSLYEGVTRTRSIRVPDPLWKSALAVAAEREESVSELLRDYLSEYVEHEGLVRVRATKTQR